MAVSDPTAVSAAAAAWSAANPAWVGVWVAVAGAFANVAALIAIAVIATQSARSTRFRLNRVAARNAISAFQLMVGIGTRMSKFSDFTKIPDGDLFDFQQYGYALSVSRPTLESLLLGVDDPELQNFAQSMVGHIALAAGLLGNRGSGRPAAKDLDLARQMLCAIDDPDTVAEVALLRRRYSVVDWRPQAAVG